MKGEKFQFVLNICGPAAHQAFDRIDGALGLCEQAAARGFANDDPTIRIEAHDRRAKCRTVRSRNTNWPASLVVPVSHQAVRCTEIDSNNSSHDCAQKILGAKAPGLQKLLLNVSDQTPDVGTAIQQVVEARHNLFTSVGVSYNGSGPFLRGTLKLRIDFAELLLKVFLRGFEARFQRRKITSRG